MRWEITAHVLRRNCWVNSVHFQRRTVVLATVDHSFLPLITSRRNSLPSSITLVDPRSPKTRHSVLDNFWHINCQSSDFLYQCYVGFRRVMLKMFLLIILNFLVLPVTDSRFLLEPLIRTRSHSFTPKTFVYTFTTQDTTSFLDHQRKKWLRHASSTHHLTPTRWLCLGLPIISNPSTTPKTKNPQGTG